jgi:hypothetical protein
VHHGIHMLCHHLRSHCLSDTLINSGDMTSPYYVFGRGHGSDTRCTLVQRRLRLLVLSTSHLLSMTCWQDLKSVRCSFFGRPDAILGMGSMGRKAAVAPGGMTGRGDAAACIQHRDKERPDAVQDGTVLFLRVCPLTACLHCCSRESALSEM